MNEFLPKGPEAQKPIEVGSELDKALGEIDAIFASSTNLPGFGKEEVKQVLKDLAVDKAKDMGQAAWEKYSEQALQRLDKAFMDAALDSAAQLQVLDVLDKYLDLQVDQGLENAAMGLNVLGQSIDIRISRAEEKLSVKEVGADFDFGAVESGFVYSPEKGIQFKMSAEAGAALIQMSGGQSGFEGARVQVNMQGTQMEFVKLGDLYEVTVKLGDHLKLGNSLDPSGAMSPSLELPFREGTLKLNPHLSFPSGKDGAPLLSGLTLNLNCDLGNLSLSSDGNSGQLSYQRTVEVPGAQVGLSAQVSVSQEQSLASTKVDLVF